MMKIATRIRTSSRTSSASKIKTATRIKTQNRLEKVKDPKTIELIEEKIEKEAEKEEPIRPSDYEIKTIEDTYKIKKGKYRTYTKEKQYFYNGQLIKKVEYAPFSGKGLLPNILPYKETNYKAGYTKEYDIRNARVYAQKITDLKTGKTQRQRFGYTDRTPLTALQQARRDALEQKSYQSKLVYQEPKYQYFVGNLPASKGFAEKAGRAYKEMAEKEKKYYQNLYTKRRYTTPRDVIQAIEGGYKNDNNIKYYNNYYPTSNRDIPTQKTYQKTVYQDILPYLKEGELLSQKDIRTIKGKGEYTKAILGKTYGLGRDFLYRPIAGIPKYLLNEKPFLVRQEDYQRGQEALKKYFPKTYEWSRYKGGKWYTDPDTRASAIMTGAGAVAVASPAIAGIGMIGMAGYEGYKTIKNPSISNVMQTGVYALGAKSTITRPIRNIYTKTGSKYIPPEQVFSREVLTGKQTFPKSKSIKEMIGKFEKATKDGVTEVTSATEFNFPRKTTAKGGAMGQKHKEDLGLWVTPMKETSPHFLRINEPTNYKLSLLPQWKTPKPQVIRIKTTPIQRMPEKILQQPYKKANIWLQQQAGKGKLFVPKRSEIMYRPELRRLGAPTSETQGIIPEGEPIISIAGKNWIGKLKGYDYYTTYKGQAVPIKDYTTNIKSTPTTLKAYKDRKGEIKRIGKETYQYYTSPRRVAPQYYTPYYGKTANYKIPPYKYELLSTKYDTGSYKQPRYENPYDYTEYPITRQPLTPYVPTYTTPTPTSEPLYYPKYTPPPQTPTTIITRTTKPQEGGGKQQRKRKDTERKQRAFFPILEDKQKNTQIGVPVATRKEAIDQGMIIADETPHYKFQIEKTEVNPGDIQKTPNYRYPNRFKQKGNTFMEKRYYRFNKPREQKGDLNIMRFIARPKAF